MSEAANKLVEVGVVLQGGGALGAYECGALNALLELMEEYSAQGHRIQLKVVSGVSIGSINAACVVGAKSSADARARLNAMWDDLMLEAPPFWMLAAQRDRVRSDRSRSRDRQAASVRQSAARQGYRDQDRTTPRAGERQPAAGIPVDRNRGHAALGRRSCRQYSARLGH